jgi:hypothetical protein
MNASEYAKANDVPLKEVFEKFGLTHHKQVIPEDALEDQAQISDLIQPEGLEVPKPREPEAKKRKEPEVVTFYWRDNKNQSFTIKGEVVGGVQGNGQFYKSDRSVLRLNATDDRKAIAYLRQHHGNEANGGRDFGEYKIEEMENSEKGSAIDRLMALDHRTLAEMAGGGVAIRRTKGQLIAEILGLKG